MSLWRGGLSGILLGFLEGGAHQGGPKCTEDSVKGSTKEATVGETKAGGRQLLNSNTPLDFSD